MAFEETRCYLPLCDSCGVDRWDTDHLPHFLDPCNDAVYRVLDELGWNVDQRPDGGRDMLCPPCATSDACARLGHDWGPMGTTDEHPLQVDACGRCCKIRRLDEPPTGHPESMTAELPRLDEEWLGAVDDELFPLEAA